MYVVGYRFSSAVIAYLLAQRRDRASDEVAGTPHAARERTGLRACH